MTKIKNLFIINLDRSKKIWEYHQSTRDFFNNKGIKVWRIQGIDFPKEIEKDPLAFNKLVKDGRISMGGFGMNNNSAKILAEIGCNLSHIRCWNTIINKKCFNIGRWLQISSRTFCW